MFILKEETTQIISQNRVLIRKQAKCGRVQTIYWKADHTASDFDNGFNRPIYQEL